MLQHFTELCPKHEHNLFITSTRVTAVLLKNIFPPATNGQNEAQIHDILSVFGPLSETVPIFSVFTLFTGSPLVKH